MIILVSIIIMRLLLSKKNKTTIKYIFLITIGENHILFALR